MLDITLSPSRRRRHLLSLATSRFVVLEEGCPQVYEGPKVEVEYTLVRQR